MAVLLLLLVAGGAGGCSREEQSGKTAGAVAQKETQPTKSGGAPSAQAGPAPGPAPGKKFGSRVPVGPRLVIQPGKGVGPIYFGATVETIERHMAAPCDIRTPQKCIYIRQALEFTLKDGVMVRAKAHFRDRPVPGTNERFGTFHGGMRPELLLGLHRHVVVEEYGEPLSREEVPLTGETGLVSRHTHEGVIFEFDKIENGNIVLSAFEVVPVPERDDTVADSTGTP